MQTERRQFPRVNITCKITAVFAERILVFNCQTIDLSERGLKTLLEEKLHPGTEVEVELVYKRNGEPIRCLSRIAWVKPKGSGLAGGDFFETGVMFIEPSYAFTEEVRKLIGSVEGKR